MCSVWLQVALGIASELLSSSKESSVSAAWTLVAGCCSAGGYGLLW